MGSWRGTSVAALAGVVLTAAVAVGGVAAAASDPVGGSAAASDGPVATAAAKKKGGKVKGCTPRRKGAKPRKGRPLCPEQRRPNIVVINTDDLDDSLIGLPAVERKLARQGTTFTNFVTSDPLCCPSRSTLLTGQYTHNHGVFGNTLATGGGFEGFRNQGNALPVWLRRAKYRTAHVGKYLNEYGEIRPAYVPPGWNEWHTLTLGREQPRWGYTLNENGKLARHGQFSTGTPASEYQTDVLSRISDRLIKRWTRSAKPFFLLFEPTNPHGEGSPPGSPRDPRPAPRHLGLFEPLSVPTPPNFNEADVSDKPAEVKARPLLNATDIAKLTIRYRSRLESLLSVSDAIGSMTGRLKKLGELDDTVIVFTSDNGFHLGQHRIVDKNTPYEESTQVPLVIRGPGFPKGKQRTTLAANIDLVPTILEIAKGRARRAQDGVSLVKLVRKPSAFAGRDILYENYNDFNSKPFVAVRTSRYVLIERIPTGERELYDLVADPYELENLAGNSGYAGLEAQLAGRLATLRTCIGASCR